MSNPNKILDTDAAIGHNDNPMQSANAPPNHHQFQTPPPPPPPPTLTTGENIDGKNTLQSFDKFVRNDVAANTTNATTGEDETGTTQTAALAATTHAPDPQLYTLPTGEIINANNKKNNVTPPTNLGTENVIIRNSNNTSDTAVPQRVTTNNTDQDHGSGNNNNNNNTVLTAYAFAVESQIVVEAEPISVLLQPQPQPHPPLQPPPLQQQRSLTFWIINTLVITSLVAAASLGVYCGTGNCKSNSGGTAMSSPNSNSGVLITPTSTPTTAAAAAAAIMVACDFLGLSIVNGACQVATTYSAGSRTDTTIPREIGLLTRLTYLDLFSNALIGTIPSELASLTQLTVLYLDGNALNGTISSELASLTQLTALL
jgi:hypothetical protein